MLILLVLLPGRFWLDSKKIKYGLKLFWMGDKPYTPIPSEELDKIVSALNELGFKTRFYLDRLLIEKEVKTK